MRTRPLDSVCATCRHCVKSQSAVSRTSRRYVQISATPSSRDAHQSLDAKQAASGQSADARFEVLGSTFSLLSASISPSQHLYTRKGTLLGFNGKPEDAVSTLSLLEPFRRAFFGIPFLYQRTTSTTPYTALIGTKSAISSLVVVHLDGRLDWMVAQRKALLAWTGQSLSLTPRVNTKMSLAHWGNTLISGRGLLALTGRGQIHQISLKAGDEYVLHPSNLIAYSVMQHAPQPYRFKSSSLRLQIPNPLGWLPNTRFWQSIRGTPAWKYTRDAAFTVRTWARRTIWGDRLFLHFQGPATILVQSRGGRLSDVLTTQDVNEIADSPAGSVQKTLTPPPAAHAPQIEPPKPQPTTMTYASVIRDGNVKFDEQQKP